MPNAINRFKPNPLVKVDKENENNDIRRRSKTLQREHVGSPKPETVWNRLSRVKKVGSNEACLSSDCRSHTNLNAKSNHRLPQVRPYAPPKLAKKPILLNSYVNKGAVADRKTTKIKMPNNPSTMSKVDSAHMLYLCKPAKSVKELLTARSMCNSKSSSENSKQCSKKSLCSPKHFIPNCYIPSDDFISCELRSSSQGSIDEFEVAPLIPVPTRDSLTGSAKIKNNFQHLLDQKHNTMEPEEISVIKDVVKIDERHHQLHKDDSKLFKVILKTQLQEILKQEHVVKSALCKLDEPPSSETLTAVSVFNQDSTGSSTGSKPQVDVIFKNVPTLEKEIIILKALGEKLEATLQRTVSKPTITPVEPLVLTDISAPMVLLELNFFVVQEYMAMMTVHPIGVRQEIGFVKEFRIARKTIVQLKEDASRHFYLPMENEKNELKRTCFKKLKQNPDILMRHLKPKSSRVPFNVLDQDPIFFNSFLYNMNPTTGAENKSDEESSRHEDMSEESVVGVPIPEGGDSTIFKATRLKNNNPSNRKQLPKSKEIALAHTVKGEGITEIIAPVQNQVSFEAPLRGKKRRRIRRALTPIPRDKVLEPKNALMKTILVGTVQILVFILLIMAITFPDIRCF